MAALRFYLHTETTLQGAPAPPTGCLTVSELAPDQTDAAAASIAGGHLSTGTSGNSQLNKPTTKDSTSVTGLPSTTAPPATVERFGWFSDVTYNGTFASAAWSFRWREDDNRTNIVGNPTLNLFASTTRDFTGTMRFLAQFDFSAADWWTGGTATSVQTITPAALTVTNEYLFLQVWCHETTQAGSGNTFTLHQEGSDLTDATRTNLLTSNFTPGGEPYPAGYVPPKQALSTLLRM